jgi:hypothetical protein
VNVSSSDTQLRTLKRLSHLLNLTSLDVSENPICELNHFHLWTVFALPCLAVLNRTTIEQAVREAANHRFDKRTWRVG